MLPEKLWLRGTEEGLLEFTLLFVLLLLLYWLVFELTLVLLYEGLVLIFGSL